MYNPISFNVIRQSLSWMGLPRPTIGREGNPFVWPSGKVTAEYKLTFALPHVISYCKRETYTRPEDINTFRRDLSEAFCEDVTVTMVGADPQLDLVFVRLHVSLDRSTPHTNRESI